MEWSGGESIAARWAALEQAKAEAHGEPEKVARFPFIPGAFDAVVRSKGAGFAKETYLDFCLEIGPGGCLWVQFDPRETSSRHLYNLRIRATGRACLLIGAEEALEIGRKVVEWFGGKITEQWVRQVHICLDLPGVSVAPFVAGLQQGRFLTTAKKWRVEDGAGGPTGITVGQRGRWLMLNVYDKLADIGVNHDETYKQAYVDRRCGGKLPEAATRVEYQVGRDWLKEKGVDTVEDLFSKLPEIVQKATAAGEDTAYPFFRLTDRVVDRENKNQGRAGVDRVWAAVVEAFRHWVGVPHGRLAKVDRERIRPEKAVKVAIGYLTRIAADFGRYCETPEDVGAALVHAFHVCSIGEGYIAEKWHKHARGSGTLRRLLDFDPSKLDPTGRLRREAEELFPIGNEWVAVPY